MIRIESDSPEGAALQALDVWHPNPEGGGWGHDFENIANCDDCRADPSALSSLIQRLRKAERQLKWISDEYGL